MKALQKYLERIKKERHNSYSNINENNTSLLALNNNDNSNNYYDKKRKERKQQQQQKKETLGIKTTKNYVTKLKVRELDAYIHACINLYLREKYSCGIPSSKTHSFLCFIC